MLAEEVRDGVELGGAPRRAGFKVKRGVCRCSKVGAIRRAYMW